MPADSKSIPPHFSTTPLHHIIPIASACKRVISLALSKRSRSSCLALRANLLPSHPQALTLALRFPRIKIDPVRAMIELSHGSGALRRAVDSSAGSRLGAPGQHSWHPQPHPIDTLCRAKIGVSHSQQRLAACFTRHRKQESPAAAQSLSHRIVYTRCLPRARGDQP